MPFYEYQCRHCGRQTEVLQKVSDAPLRKCPACGRNGLTKLISAPIFRLKGGGWYETDFKGEQDRKRNLAGDEPPPAKDDKPAEKSAAKPAEKPADKPAAKAKEKPAAKAKRRPAAKPARKTPAKRR
ncbi:MAG: zinc ribbon domain-containing protein [Gammaproteobacteria bacterium]|nr:zinc ribbon domain-containing protein [Gammaproteobacteria bacterium]